MPGSFRPFSMLLLLLRIAGMPNKRLLSLFDGFRKLRGLRRFVTVLKTFFVSRETKKPAVFAATSFDCHGDPLFMIALRHHLHVLNISLRILGIFLNEFSSWLNFIAHQ